LRLTRADSLVDAEADLLLIPLAEGVSLPAAARPLDRALGGVLQEILGGDFKAKFAEVEATRTLGRSPARRVALLGLGRPEQLDATRLRNAIQLGLKSAGGGAGVVAVAWTGAPSRGITAGDVASAVVGAAVRAGWNEGSHKSDRRSAPGLKTLSLVGFPAIEKRDLDRAVIIGEATNLARDLVNRPASELTPEALAAEARALARRHGFDYQALGKAELQRLGYGAILAVASGSVRPPRLVVLRHRARRQGGARLALVGKGITFDSGGISIKPAADMQYMRGDMGGAAAVLGAMSAIARLKLDVDVTGILCCAENMASGTAMRPGDVVTSGAGKTIEVINTDAEGRMVLADGVHHAVTMGATHVVDIATLTGAQRVALGPVAAMILGSDPPFTAQVVEAAASAGERVWEMPTFAEYQTQLQSTVADLNNSPGRDGGAITAGLFVREFAAGLPWVHIDMAAPSWNRVASVQEVPRGPSGFGVGTLAGLAAGMAGSPPKVESAPKSDRTGRK
jgi:leucyl aminopeptidase